MITHRLSLGLFLALAVILAGCGSSSQPPAPSEARPTPNAEEATSSPSAKQPEPEPGDSLSTVGTLTETDGEGTTFSDNFRLGPLLSGGEHAPPEEVLDACNLTDPAEVAESVFARGQVTLTYQEGQLPVQVNLGGGYGGVQEVTTGEGYGEGALDSAVAFQVGDEWWCVTGGGAIEFQKGESQTLPIWVLVSRVLSNAHPQVPKDILDRWYFEELGPPLGMPGINHSVATTGPGAGRCARRYGASKEQLLFLYNRSGGC